MFTDVVLNSPSAPFELLGTINLIRALRASISACIIRAPVQTYTEQQHNDYWVVEEKANHPVIERMMTMAKNISRHETMGDGPGKHDVLYLQSESHPVVSDGSPLLGGVIATPSDLYHRLYNSCGIIVRGPKSRLTINHRQRANRLGRTRPTAIVPTNEFKYWRSCV